MLYLLKVQRLWRINCNKFIEWFNIRGLESNGSKKIEKNLDVFSWSTLENSSSVVVYVLEHAHISFRLVILFFLLNKYRLIHTLSANKRASSDTCKRKTNSNVYSARCDNCKRAVCTSTYFTWTTGTISCVNMYLCIPKYIISD